MPDEKDFCFHLLGFKIFLTQKVKNSMRILLNFENFNTHEVRNNLLWIFVVLSLIHVHKQNYVFIFYETIIRVSYL